MAPTSRFDYYTALKDLQLFARKLVLKKLHNTSCDNLGLSPQELEAIKT